MAVKLDKNSILRIMRKTNTRQGQLLEYLKAHEGGGSDLAMAAMMSFYLPYSLRSAGVSEKEITECVLDVISDLESHIVKLKRTFGMEGLSQVVLVHPANQVGSTTAPPAIPTQLTVPQDALVAVQSQQTEDLEDDEYDDFFADDSDVIPSGMVEDDPGFRL